MQRKCRCPNTKFLLFMLNNIKEWLSIAWEKKLSKEIELAKYFVVTVYTYTITKPMMNYFTAGRPNVSLMRGYYWNQCFTGNITGGNVELNSDMMLNNCEN